jgi:hypothetical protein
MIVRRTLSSSSSFTIIVRYAIAHVWVARFFFFFYCVTEIRTIILRSLSGFFFFYARRFLFRSSPLKVSRYDGCALIIGEKTDPNANSNLRECHFELTDKIGAIAPTTFYTCSDERLSSQVITGIQEIMTDF